jgi:hypothetical protein
VLPKPQREITDPISAAIEKYENAYARHGAAVKRTDAAFVRKDGPEKSAELKKLEKQQDRACKAETDAIRAISRTVPTTLAGAAAMVRLVDDANKRGDYFLRVFVDNNPERTDRTYCSVPFLESLRESLERLATSTAVTA